MASWRLRFGYLITAGAAMGSAVKIFQARLAGRSLGREKSSSASLGQVKGLLMRFPAASWLKVMAELLARSSSTGLFIESSACRAQKKGNSKGASLTSVCSAEME